MSEPSRTQRGVAFLLTAGFAVAAVWRVVLALQEYAAGFRITDDPSARELREASALVELGLAIILMVHASGTFIYTRREVTLRVAAAVLVAVMSSLGLVVALNGALGSVYPALMILMTAVAGYRCPGQWLSFYVGAVVGCAVAWGLAAPDPDPFVGLFVIVPSVVLALVGTALGSWVSRRSMP